MRVVLLELFQLVLEFLNLVVDKAQSSNPSIFYVIVLSLAIILPISQILLTKVGVDIIAKIMLVTLVGMIFRLFVHAAWCIILTIVAKS